MSGNVWVFAEQWRGRISEITYEALALGKELAGALQVPLEAILLGHNVLPLAGTLGKADTVLAGEHPALAELVPGLYAEALAALVEERAPCAVLIPLTNISLGMGTLLAARLHLPSVNFCQDVRAAAAGIEARCVLYGGKIESRVTAAGTPAIFGIWSGARSPEAGRSDRAPSVEEVRVTVPDDTRVRLKRYIEPEAGDVDITRQEVLVAVGRGIQSPENLALAEDLARSLGGAVCASRPVIDQGWLPLSRQVGKSGLTVKPKLYVALGISGAPEHVEGMRDSSLIVAVNSDPRAPIFGVAHYGIVGDVLEVLPALTAAIEARKEAHSHA
ncbi:MAG TPA: electron transfer flavoprotein subunit alpha/FixB family protein [Bryobacteraceae bacterium]|nr:electron transfer flavoprotein subunit alpha/FixB family protein [Bryobacteraceae bacterium]